MLCLVGIKMGGKSFGRDKLKRKVYCLLWSREKGGERIKLETTFIFFSVVRRKSGWKRRKLVFLLIYPSSSKNPTSPTITSDSTSSTKFFFFFNLHLHGVAALSLSLPICSLFLSCLSLFTLSLTLLCCPKRKVFILFFLSIATLHEFYFREFWRI